MTQAGGKFLCHDFLEVERLEISTADGTKTFPHIIFKEWTWKFLQVELFEVPLDEMEDILDDVEGCLTDDSPYKRVKLKTQGGKEVWAYDSNWWLGSDLEGFFMYSKMGKRYYGFEK